MDIIVLDVGTQTLRAGYALSFPSEDEPRVQRPSAVEDYSVTTGFGVSFDATQPLIRCPVQGGDVCDLDALESLIHHTLYDSLGWQVGQEGAVIVAEPLLTTRRTRELVSQLMFEVFNVDGLFMQDQASLSLYAMGKLTGCVVDVGHGKVDVATVTDGQANSAIIKRLAFGGAVMTEFLALRLAASPTAITPQNVELLKEACAQVAPSAEAYSALVGAEEQVKTSWQLPDGQTVTISQQDSCMIGEALMNPAVLKTLPFSGFLTPGLQAWAQGPSLPNAVAECLISTSQLDLLNKRSGHAKDVLVCGGGSLMPDLSSRLIYELKQTCPPEPIPGLCVIPEYIPAAHGSLHAAWLGGAVLGRVIAGQGHWVTRWDYDEFGPTIVNRKCG